jgi:hypothetical protein
MKGTDSFFEKLIVRQPKNWRHHRFITFFTSTRLNHLNPVHKFITHFYKINLNIILQYAPRFLSNLSPSFIRNKRLYAFLIYPMRTTCPIHYIFGFTILCEERFCNYYWVEAVVACSKLPAQHLAGRTDVRPLQQRLESRPMYPLICPYFDKSW